MHKIGRSDAHRFTPTYIVPYMSIQYDHTLSAPLRMQIISKVLQYFDNLFHLVDHSSILLVVIVSTTVNNTYNGFLMLTGEDINTTPRKGASLCFEHPQRENTEGEIRASSSLYRTPPKRAEDMLPAVSHSAVGNEEE